MTKRLLLGTIVLFTAAMLCADDAAHGSFDRTMQVNGPVDMQVVTGSGAIHVHSGGASSVVIHGEIRASRRDGEEAVRRVQQNPPIEQSGNSIRITRIKDYDLSRNVSISYDITVPENTRLDAQTGSGSEEIIGLKGRVSAHSGSGSLRASDIQGDLNLEAGSGSIALQNVSGSVRAHTGSGSVRGSDLGYRQSNANSRIDIETGSGSVSLEHVRGALSAHTGSGRISVSGEPSANWQLRTGSGGAIVKLPANASFNVRAHAGSGTITIDYPVTLEAGTVGEHGRHHIEGKVRDGGPLLEVQTGSGSIHITTGGSGGEPL